MLGYDRLYIIASIDKDVVFVMNQWHKTIRAVSKWMELGLLTMIPWMNYK